MRYVAQTVAIPALKNLLNNPHHPISEKELKSCIADFSRPAHNINGFFASNSRAFLDHSSALRFTISNGYISISLGILRSLLERISVAWTIARKLKPLAEAANLPHKEAMDVLLDHNEAVVKALYGTTRDWVKISKRDISKGSPDEDEYEIKPGHGDLSARGILNYIQDLDRRVPGLSRSYQILCEFAHPNVGDLFSSTTQFSWRDERCGLRIYTREIAEATGKDGLNSDIKRVLENLAEPCCNAIEKIPEILIAAHTHKSASEKITKKWMRSFIIGRQHIFTRDELCPCLFGARIYQCCGKST